jgi:hypothetical protein
MSAQRGAEAASDPGAAGARVVHGRSRTLSRTVGLAALVLAAQAQGGPGEGEHAAGGQPPTLPRARTTRPLPRKTRERTPTGTTRSRPGPQPCPRRFKRLMNGPRSHFADTYYTPTRTLSVGRAGQNSGHRVVKAVIDPRCAQELSSSHRSDCRRPGRVRVR